MQRIENAADIGDRMLLENSNGQHDDGSWYESFEYTRTLDKAYHFFKDGHVQNIKCHPWTTQPDVICVKATSMRKDRIYHIKLVIRKSCVRVITAFCTCPAGLSGCCNHITATLYALEDYVHLGLREQEKLGCTEKLQTWNHPRKNM